jgi:hypothetical protein
MAVAALLEEHTPEVFETVLGNIPPKAVVKIQLVYVNDLKADLSGEGLLVTIPTFIAPRYGQPPVGYSASSQTIEVGLKIVVRVNSLDPIKKLDCRSHPISVEMGTSGRPSRALTLGDLAKARKEEIYSPKKATASLSDDNASLDRDFVLFIVASGASLLRSQALLSPPNSFGHAALMVTIKPSELFVEIPALNSFNGEIIFLADRSGSMAGSKINTLRDALHVFLKSLPETCLFNIFSFGSHSSSLWDTSQQYNQKNLESAMSHISQFKADMGGTELLSALQHVTSRRTTGRGLPQILILTDGEVWNTEETISFVSTKASSELGTLFRFFALGIGNEVSYRLVQGIGSYGGGFSDVVGINTKGEWQKGVIRMLKGALMPDSWNYELQLHSGSPLTAVTIDNFLGTTIQQPTPVPIIRYVQAPQKLPPLHHFNQRSIYFLLHATENTELPATVVVKAMSHDGVERTCTLSALKTVSDGNTIQQLATKAMFLDLEAFPGEKQSQVAARQCAERLGELYSIPSKWASFVAVDPVTHCSNMTNTYKTPLADLKLLTNYNVGSDRSYPQLPHVYPTEATSLLRTASCEGVEYVNWQPKGQSPRKRAKNATYEPLTREPLFHGEYIGSSPVLCEASQMTAASNQVGKSDRPSDPPFAWPETSETADFSLDFSPHELGFLELYPPSIEPISTSTPQLSRELITISQTANGLFDFGVKHREMLNQHFCEGTRGKLLLMLIPPETRLDRSVFEKENPEAMVDTIMIVCYIKTHLKQEEDLLALMIRKAEDTLAKSVAVEKNKELLTAMAYSSMVHEHFKWYLMLRDSPPLTSCRICHDIAPDAQEESPDIALPCPMVECNASFANWKKLWDHQVSVRHLIC